MDYSTLKTTKEDTIDTQNASDLLDIDYRHVLDLIRGEAADATGEIDALSAEAKPLIDRFAKQYADNLSATAKDLLQAFKSDSWKQLEEIFDDLSVEVFFESLESICREAYYKGEDSAEAEPSLQDCLIFFDSLENALPCMPEIISKYKESTGLDAITFWQFVDNHDPATGEPSKSMLFKCVEMQRPSLEDASNTDASRHAKSITPKEFYTPNSKLWNNLPNYIFEANCKRIESNCAIPVNISPRNKKTCEILITVNYDTDIFTYSDRLDEYDKIINAAFGSLVCAGNIFITAEMVYRIINGLTNSERVARETSQEIENRIDRQRKIEIKIDARQQLNSWKSANTKGLKAYYSDYLIVAAKGECVLNGVRVAGYFPHSVPVVFGYSSSIGQIHSVPLDLLDVKQVTKDGKLSCTSYKKSTTRTLINHYVLNRIEAMRNEKNHVSSRRIKLSDIYKAAGTNIESSAGRRNAQRARKAVFEALDFYKSKGLIKGYKTDGGKTQKGGHKAYTYVDIIL